MRRRIYVAGAYSAGNTQDTFRHMRAGIKAGIQLVEAGYAPYIPWLDWPAHLLQGIPLDVCYEWSMAWLAASEAMLVLLDDIVDSKGTRQEIRYAVENHIPICHSVDELKALWS